MENLKIYGYRKQIKSVPYRSQEHGGLDIDTLAHSRHTTSTRKFYCNIYEGWQYYTITKVLLRKIHHFKNPKYLKR
jgi:hypothetical protein